MRVILTLVSVFLFGGWLTGAVAARESRQLTFDVYLEDKKIGQHEYDIDNRGGRIHVSSQARFDVRFLFFTAYTYRHTANERWEDDCLRFLDARTVTNGDKQFVSGEYESGEFIVSAGEGKSAYAECVMTFAYWNQDFLEEDRLLNPQTGAYLDVEVEKLGKRNFRARGQPIKAAAYRIVAKDLEVTVFYSDEGDWVGLESTPKGDRTLRYEIIG